MFKQVYFPHLMHNCWKVYFSTFHTLLHWFVSSTANDKLIGEAGKAWGKWSLGEEKHFYWNVPMKTEIF